MPEGTSSLLEKSNVHYHSIQDISFFHTWSKKHCTMQIPGRFLLGSSMSAPPEKHRSTSAILADVRAGRCTVVSLVVKNNSIASAEYRIHFLNQSVVKKLFYLSNCQIGWGKSNLEILRISKAFSKNTEIFRFSAHQNEGNLCSHDFPPGKYFFWIFPVELCRIF